MTNKIVFRSFIIIATTVISFNSFAQTYKEWMYDPTIRISKTIERAEKYFALNPNKKERKQFERWKYFSLRNQDSSGYLQSRKECFNSFKRHQLNKPILKNNTLTGHWQELGPFSADLVPGLSSGVGRVTSFAFDPNNKDILIIGSETGGIWKSIDRGENWTPLLDDYSTMVVYSVSIDPINTNIYYFGSKNGLLYQSLDAGITWNLFHDFDEYSLINKISIHPLDSSKLFVSLEKRGLYTSLDGGSTWNKISSKGFDFEFKPSNPNTVYAAGKKVYKSIDSGMNWEILNTGLSLQGDKMIAVTDANPDKLFVLDIDDGEFVGLGVSSDSGENFNIKTPSHNFNFSQAPRDMAITVSPTNENEIHLGGIETYRSLDGGNSFTRTSKTFQDLSFPYCHADIDDLTYMDTTLVAITDGGIFFSKHSNGPLDHNYFEDKSHGLGIHQLYKLGVSQTNPVIITAGAQDNGSSRYENGLWKNWYGGDGMEGYIHNTNSNRMIGSLQNGKLVKTFDAGLTASVINIPSGVSTNWVTPIEQDPEVENTMYVAYNKVYKSEHFGVNLYPISQDFGYTLNNLKIAPADNKTIYASSFFELYKTEIGGGTWDRVNIPFEQSFISDIAIHPNDKNKVALACSGLGVLITVDGGKTFSQINEGLPTLYPLSLAWHDNGANGLYVGTFSTGVYYRDDNTVSWTYFSDNLPNVEISELEINSADNKLYAATYGRGVWCSNLYSNSNESIVLGDFIAELVNRKIKLSWFTYSERDLKEFTLEKSSDGMNWSNLAEIDAKGNSSLRKNYNVWDENPIHGINYYRLKTIDQSNEIVYSAVEDINLSGVDLLSIYPNPNNGIFSLYINAKQNNLVKLTIHDLTGKKVHSQHQRTNMGINEIRINSQLHKGIYFISLTVDGEVIYKGKRIVIMQ